MRLRAAGSGVPYLPARRASIRLHLDRHERAAALAEAVALAEAAGDESLSDDLRRGAATWLGRLTATLEAPWDADAKPPVDLAEADAAIRAALGPAGTAHYDAGRRALNDEYVVRSAEAEREIERLASARENRTAAALDAITEDRDKAQDRKDDVKRTAGEWKSWLDTRLAEIDTELTPLAETYRQLTAGVEVARSSVANLNLQIAQAESDALAGGGRVRRPGAPRAGNPLPTLISARDEALSRYTLLTDRATAARRRGETLTGAGGGRRPVRERDERPACQGGRAAPVGRRPEETGRQDCRRQARRLARRPGGPAAIAGAEHLPADPAGRRTRPPLGGAATRRERRVGRVEP